MYTTSPDQLAFLASIREQPDDDTARLAYADWLDEHGDDNGDRARAEFIRVQCELVGVMHCGQPEGKYHSNGCSSCDLRKRERELLARYEADWRRGPECERCGGCGWDSLPERTPSKPNCPDCHGTGDAGGLTWPLTRGTGSGGWFVRETNWPLVTFRRGFPFTVTCPRLADALVEVECPRCRARDEKQNDDMRRLGGYLCKECDTHHPPGRVLRPTPWLAAVLSAHPVAEVVPLDREPTREEGGWEWYDLPDQLNTMRTKQTFATPELAKSALGQEIVYVGRTKR